MEGPGGPRVENSNHIRYCSKTKKGLHEDTIKLKMSVTDHSNGYQYGRFGVCRHHHKSICEINGAVPDNKAYNWSMVGFSLFNMAA